MSKARIPKRLSEQILSDLAYADRPTADEFTLSRYQRSIESVIKDNYVFFNGQDYEALALVYFNQGKFEAWESTLLKSIEKFRWPNANSSLALGRLTVQERDKNYNFKPVVDEFYRFAELLQSDDTFTFNRITDRLLGLNQVKLKNSMDSTIQISKDYIVEIFQNDVSFKFELEYLIELDWDIAFVILQNLCIKITNGTISDKEKNLINFIFPDSILEKFIHKATPVALS